MPLKLERVVILHVHIGDPEVPIWFSAVNNVAVAMSVRNSVKDHDERGILPSVRERILRN